MGTTFELIVWVNGPFYAGHYSDVKIYQEYLKEKLAEDEFVIEDDGYDDATVLNGLDVPDYMHNRSEVRARNEAVNGKRNRLNVLTRTFRHDRRLHVLCFNAVENILQEVILLEEQLLQLNW